MGMRDIGKNPSDFSPDSVDNMLFPIIPPLFLSELVIIISSSVETSGYK